MYAYICSCVQTLAHLQTCLNSHTPKYTHVHTHAHTHIHLGPNSSKAVGSHRPESEPCGQTDALPHRRMGSNNTSSYQKVAGEIGTAGVP